MHSLLFMLQLCCKCSLAVAHQLIYVTMLTLHQEVIVFFFNRLPESNAFVGLNSDPRNTPADNTSTILFVQRLAI